MLTVFQPGEVISSDQMNANLDEISNGTPLTLTPANGFALEGPPTCQQHGNVVTLSATLRRTAARLTGTMLEVATFARSVSTQQRHAGLWMNVGQHSISRAVVQGTKLYWTRDQNSEINTNQRIALSTSFVVA